ncbi:MAG: carbon-nitrogen hydrolase family protein [Clostridiales Family XIII bacterium]|jgi:predicted amidohydrolase|nr:carbon-nitrogen hydrolase family protein [Clostridiales Family XIII bacterium]
MSVTYKLALCQMRSSMDKAESMEKAARYVKSAATGGASVVSLPEMWNCPYDNAYFREYAEGEDGPSVAFMADLARANGIYLIGGSIPELQEGRVYNTSYIFDPDGQLLKKHRKVHLFDIDVKGGVRFKESDTLSSGDSMTVVDTEFGKIGVAICYDIRFPEMFAAMTKAGAHLMLLPAAFNMTTGPAHWELLMRGRALDNQVYVAACSQARDVEARYRAYGHSLIANPWGELCGAAAANETVVFGDIDIAYMEQVRNEIPTKTQRRADIYSAAF